MRGMPGKVINWMNAMRQVTVPKITRHHAQELRAGVHQHGAAGATRTKSRCWPTADLGFMDPAVSVNVLHGVKAARRSRALQATARGSVSATLRPGDSPNSMKRRP